MNKERSGFVFLGTFYESIEDLETQDKCIMLQAIIEYGLYGVEPNLTKGYLKGIWKLITSTIDATSRKYDASVENGKKGGAPKGNSNAKKQPKTTQEQPINNPITTLKEKKIELKKIELNKIELNKIELKENNIEENEIELDFGKYNNL